jgi:hypothetical protein
MTWNSENCCLKANGRYCTPLERWTHAATPAAWLGREMVPGSGSTDSSQDAAVDVSANPDSDSAAAVEEEEEEDEDEEEEAAASTNSDDSDGSSPADTASPQPAPEDGSLLPAAPTPTIAVDELPVPSPGPKADSTSSGASWRKATSTFYNSYPDCCSSKKANQRECLHYNGCQWQGLFAAFNKKMSRQWVESTNIAAFYASPNSQNRREWRRKWMNKRLRIRNPTTGNTLEVQVSAPPCGWVGGWAGGRAGGRAGVGGQGQSDAAAGRPAGRQCCCWCLDSLLGEGRLEIGAPFAHC